MAEPLTSQAWVSAWLQEVSQDLETAERALHAGHAITDTAAYHCHQAADYAAARRDSLVKLAGFQAYDYNE